MELKKGTTVRHRGQTYKGSVPDDVAIAVGLKKTPEPKPEAAPKTEAGKEKKP